VGSIVILASPLSATSLDRLLGVPEGTVDSRTDLLHSALSIPLRPNHPIRLLHLSFRDFLVDTEKRETNPFWVEEKQAHQRIANRCIRLVSSSLKQDICGLEAPGVLATDVVSSRVDQCLPPEVKYACLYWIQHLQRSGAQLRDNDQVYKFLQGHLLHWLEVLNWIGKTSEGILGILSLETQISVSIYRIIKKSRLIYTKADENPNLYAFVHDAKRFALYNRLMIEKAPLQLYSSALIFAPERSLVRSQFEECISHWIVKKPKVQANWSTATDARRRLGRGYVSRLLAGRQAGRVWLLGRDGPALGRRNGSTATDARGPLRRGYVSRLLAGRQAGASSTCVK
jgi:hypothetical protein